MSKSSDDRKVQRGVIQDRRKLLEESKEAINHPLHYGGEDNPYEVIKVIEAWGLNFNLGNTVKYIGRAHHKGKLLEDLKKAAWYLQREIDSL